MVPVFIEERKSGHYVKLILTRLIAERKRKCKAMRDSFRMHSVIILRNMLFCSLESIFINYEVYINSGGRHYKVIL
jgi:hypothetical protein